MASLEMELEEWEFLPDNSLFRTQSKEENSSPFRRDQHELLAQIEAEKTTDQKDPDDVLDQEIKEMSEESDAIFQVEKLEEIECKVGSPKSSGEGHGEVNGLDDSEQLEITKSLSFEEGEERKEDDEVEGKDSFDGFNPSIWGWKLTGIGALSSLGIAAATLSMIIFAGRHRNQSQELQIQIYGGGKRIKHEMHQATRLNRALLAVRGAPAATADISFGGYHRSF